MSDEQRTITFGAATFTRLQQGRSRGYGWTGAKWQCDVCLRRGCGEELIPAEWSRSCARGHTPCRWCSAQLSVCMDGTTRVHARCPNRPESEQSAWDGAKHQLVLSRLVNAIGERDV